MEERLNVILNQFRLDAPAVDCAAHGCGHINATYLVTTASGRRYILQKINDHIFRDVPALMRNIRLVTDHLHRQSDDPRCAMTIIQTNDGADFLASDGFWRVYDYVEHSLCLQSPENDADFLESARAFGAFQQQLKDFPAGELAETIPNFHNTPDRFRIFRETLKKDPMGRAKEVAREIDFLMEREEKLGMLQGMRDCGDLPTRVTHNDTKLNNVLLDNDTRRALCVIDLDTVMPGLTAYDFGDSIRFGAATAAEDEPDPSKMKLDLHLFEIYTKGFLEAARSLTDREVQMMPMGALIMTLEVGMRFLTDYLEGDLYFKTAYPEHNLVRSRTQLALVADMQDKWEEMNRIVADVARQVRG